MNKKNFKKIKAKELDSLLDALGMPRMDIAELLGVGESTFRRWVRNRNIPIFEWEKLNSDDFKKTLEIRKKFGSNQYVVPEKHESNVEGVHHSISPPDGDEYREEYGLEDIPAEALVAELERREWIVTLNRKK